VAKGGSLPILHNFVILSGELFMLWVGKKLIMMLLVFIKCLLCDRNFANSFMYLNTFNFFKRILVDYSFCEGKKSYMFCY